MKNITSLNRPRATPRHARSARYAALLPMLPIAAMLTACGGDGGSDGGSGNAYGPQPILQVGMQRQYIGTTTRDVVYANPTTSQPNNTLVYSFVENQNVLQAPATAPAAFDVNTSYTFSVVQDPGVGIVPVSQTVDSYENLLVSGSTQMVSTLAQQSVATSTDETANALGGGPYTETVSTNSTFPTARNSFSYPLQTGATQSVPQSAQQAITFSDVNAAGAAPPNGTNVGYTRNRTASDDGSYSYQTAFVNGTSQSLTQNPDGSGSITTTTPTATTTTTLGLPTALAGVTTLPVIRNVVDASTGATTTTSYAAADWYPSNGQPDSPLVLSSQTVIGPVATLPSACSGALVRPDIVEIDTTTTNLATVVGTYSVTQTRSFNADGVTVCALSQETSYVYSQLTGALVSTTTTLTNTLLNAINY